MTAQPRALAVPTLRGRAIVVTMVATFGVGMFSGLAASRIVSGDRVAVPVAVAPAAAPGLAAATHSTVAGATADSLSGDRITVNAATGFTVRTPTRGPIVSDFTGFTLGTIAVGPVVNAWTGFALGDSAAAQPVPGGTSYPGEVPTRGPTVDPYTGFTIGQGAPGR